MPRKKLPDHLGSIEVRLTSRTAVWESAGMRSTCVMTVYQSEYEEIITGLIEMRDEALQNANSIRQTRTLTAWKTETN
jgi:predicted esterase YcpF (UPF0227 family)